MGFSELDFLGQIASFESRLRGVAPTPLEFFRLGLSMGFSELEFLGQIASFERRLRGAAPTPLALPYYPFCTSTT